MRRTKRLWIPILLGALLIATLVGAASARPNSRPQEQAWRVLTVAPHACNPRTDTIDYNYLAGYLLSNGNTAFVCPMDFPAAGEQAVGAVNVKRVTAYVLDNDGNAGDTIRFYFRKVYPMGGDSYQAMAEAESTESASDPQVIMDTSIDYNPVYRSQAPYVWVVMEAAGHKLYGVYVHYTW
jgi:hypothetical protein